jgi:gas vesicle protein
MQQNQGTFRHLPHREEAMADLKDQEERDEAFDENAEDGEGGGVHTGSLLTGLIIGAVLGAGAALLLAPQSGEKTRRMLRKRGTDFRRDAERKLVRARKDARRLVRDKKEALLERVNEGIERLEERLNG